MNNYLNNYITIIEKLKKRKVCSRFENNIWATDLTEMQSFCSKNESNKYLLCIIDVFTKYAWVKPLKDKKKCKTVLNAPIKIVNESNRKLNKLWLIKEENFTIN